MRKLLLILTIAKIPFATKADVCFRTFEEDTAISDIIFIGKVDTNYYDHFWQAGIPRKITNFIVYKLYKGNVPSYISILGSLSASNINYHKDSIYLVFANEVEPLNLRNFKDYHDKGLGIYWANSCSHTKLLSKSMETIEKLGQALILDPNQNEYLQALLAHRKEKEDEVRKQAKMMNTKLQEQRDKINFYRTVFYVTLGILIILIVLIIIKNVT